MSDTKNIERLFQWYLDNKCTPDEIRELLLHFDVSENEDLLRSLIHKQSSSNDDTTLITNQIPEDLSDTSFEKIKQAIAAGEEKKTLVVLLNRRLWFRLSAAVIIIFLLSVTTFYFIHKKNQTVIAQNETNIQSAKDIPPGTNNAVLTLDNGTSIVLDSAANGTLAQQGNVKVLKINGQIAYKTGTENRNAKPVYNTITTKRGNEYELILADGSKVWLNAASSIRFPTSFVGNERKVEITGEAYFEVAHNASKPFKVEFNTKADGAGEIEVLGTHFDVNAYPDEENIKTTLLKGSVKIKRANQVQMLLPGQQAILTSNTITLKKDVDVFQVVAWKDGFFVFNNTDLQSIMRQVARWYNIDVNFEGKISSDGFTGKISRNVPLSDFLKVLQLNNVHVNAEGRKVTIIS